jgi:hypothetical protein
MVKTAKTAVTSIIPETLCFAAGYIRMGISGSQGPKTKMVNKIQGVMLAFPEA